MLMDAVRVIYERCAGVRLQCAYDGASGGVSSSAFQRLSKRLNVQPAVADLIFVKICTRDSGGFSNRMMSLEQFTDGLLALAGDEKSGIECAGGGEEGVARTLELVVEKLL